MKFLVIILIQLVLPLASVFLYERLRGHSLPVSKRITLYFLFTAASVLAGYAALLIFREQVYHEWLFTELLSTSGLLIRFVIPLVTAVSLPFIVHYYRKLTDHFFKEEDFDNKLLKQYGHCTLCLFTLFFITFVSMPVYIAIGVEEPLETKVLITVTLIIGAASLLLGAVVFLLWRNYRYIEGLVSGLMALCFFNAYVLPFHAEVLDGRQEFARVLDNPVPLVRNVILFVILSGLMTIFRKHLRFTAVPLLLIAIVFSAGNIYTMSSADGDVDRNTPTQEDMFESASTLSSEQNIVVIVMDMMQGSVVERTFMEYPQLYDSYEGFTVFSRAFSSFPFTYFSDSTIQSGKLYPSDDPTWLANFAYSFQDSFMADMRDEGMLVSLMGGRPWRAGDQVDFPWVYRSTSQRPWTAYISASSAALARVVGYWMQSPFNLIQVGAWESSTHADLINNMVGDIELMERLINNLSVSGTQSRLIYFWSLATHTPVVFSKDGQIGVDVDGWIGRTEQHLIDETFFVTMQLARLFGTMKELGVYDNSLIIIVSDHGTHLRSPSNEQHSEFMRDYTDGNKKFGNFRPIHYYNAVMMVKPPDLKSGALITHDPAWIGDVRSLINRYHGNFTNKLPSDVIKEIRAENPEVGVMFAPKQLDTTRTSENHEIIFVTSLHDIAAAFEAHSSHTDD